MERVLAINNSEGLCWKCLKEYDKSNIYIIKIGELGYGSSFDGENTEIHLCDKCYNESLKNNSELWNMEEIYCEWDTDLQGFTQYKYESEILDYISNLPIQGKQLVWNEFAHGYGCEYKMDAQDWIDYQLGILPHDKCKEYWLYSKEEIKAYKERFPTCEHPVNRIYEDGSSGCWCPFGAYGEHGQNTGSNICEECYNCKFYKERTTKIKDINDEDYDEYETLSKAILILKSKSKK